ncbi:hypothetical protein [Paenibacillus polymyxa]|uniref:hypothetical protein n=1 Tax=Paenibacillus polymyxa TaxID=1406 RepID=UPI00237A08DA|nr:hypothetical protein [Paenibacillus polymyxa]WDM19972.1 hypothetical protein J4I02_12730 [Paenibacillus polymyxa]
MGLIAYCAKSAFFKPEQRIPREKRGFRLLRKSQQLFLFLRSLTRHRVNVETNSEASLMLNSSRRFGLRNATEQLLMAANQKGRLPSGKESEGCLTGVYFTRKNGLKPRETHVFSSDMGFSTI